MIIESAAEPLSQDSRRRVILAAAAAVVVAAVLAVVWWPSNGSEQPSQPTTRPTIGVIVGPAEVESSNPLSRP